MRENQCIVGKSATNNNDAWCHNDIPAAASAIPRYFCGTNIVIGASSLRTIRSGKCERWYALFQECKNWKMLELQLSSFSQHVRLWCKLSCSNALPSKHYLNWNRQEMSQNASLWIGFSPIGTHTPDGPLMLWNYFINFCVEHWFGCRTTESGFTGDIGAIDIWLIDCCIKRQKNLQQTNVAMKIASHRIIWLALLTWSNIPCYKDIICYSVPCSLSLTTIN